MPGGDCSDDEFTFSSHFTTNQNWASMTDLKDWVTKVGLELSMVITTKPSEDKNKIIFHCEESGSYRATKKMKLGECSEATPKSENNECPFMLHGIFIPKSFNSNPGWKLEVVKAHHNHPLSTDLSGHPFASSLTEENRDASSAKPNVIASRKLTVMQYTLSFLKERGYFYSILDKNDADGNKVVTNLFISHPDARRLLKAFPNTVIMDSTYDTNRYGMLLLEFVGFTSTNHTYCIALAFLKKETTKHYLWALRRLNWLFGPKQPICIVSNGEIEAVEGVERAFGNVRHLLSHAHVDREVREHASEMNVDPDRFSSSVHHLMRSRSKSEYGERLGYFRRTWKSSGLVDYVESTWFTPLKEKLVGAWCNDVLHFATRSSDRVESSLSAMKDMMVDSPGGYDTIVQHIDNMFIDQTRRIKEKMVKKTPVKISNGPKWLKVFFKLILGKCSETCLTLLLGQALKAKNGEIFNEYDPRDIWWNRTMGLPSPRQVKIYVEEGIPCPLGDIDMFWKQQIKWGDDSDKKYTHEDGFVRNSIWNDIFKIFVGKYRRGEIERDGTLDFSNNKFTQEDAEASLIDIVEKYRRGELDPDIIFVMAEKMLELTIPGYLKGNF